MKTRPNKSLSFHVYGPVPSRRLGFSLGIDILPSKTCTLDCIYCQLGPTADKTLRRRKYYSAEEILAQIKNKISSGQRIDYITFSGSGEPTLNTILGKLIREIKKITSLPVAVLTNSTLLPRKDTRAALLEADLLAPSLDAATQEIFEKINKPCSPLKIKEVIDSLISFRREFKGLLWLEIMLVKGVNDFPEHINRLKEAVLKINPDKVQLNTVVRPPAKKFAGPLSLDKLEKIKKVFGKNCEIIADFNKKTQKSLEENLEVAILAMVKRRPVTLSDISTSLGKHKNEILKYINLLLEQGKVRAVFHKGLKYFEPT